MDQQGHVEVADNGMGAGSANYPPGASVYDADGEKLGTVSDRQDKEGFLVVHKGRFLGHDALVPRAAVEREDASGVYLRVRKDDLKGTKQTPLPEPSTPMTPITGAPTAFAADPLPVPVVTGVPEPELGLPTAVGAASAADGSRESPSAVDTIREQVGPRVDTMRERVGPLAEQVKEQASTVAQQQMSSTAEGLDSAAGAVNAVGERLRENNLGDLSHYTDLAAEQIEKLASWLRTTTPEEIAQDIEDFAKKQPAVFVAGALALGLIGVRFLRSTSQNADPEALGRD
jgi:hypothetical protein